jgi:hypothetical protein
LTHLYEVGAVTKNPMTFVCQSCAALVRHPREAGTDARGQRVRNYCRKCYGNGRFVEPHLTLVEMIRRVEGELRAHGMSACSTAAELAETIAGLERWRPRDAARKTSREIPTKKTPRLVVSRRSDRR